MTDYLKTFLAGGGGGCSLAVVGQPLDTIKVRIQTGQSTMGIMGTGMGIVRKEGVMALWKGLLPPVMASTPMYALCFFGYGVGKEIFCDDDAFDEGNFKLGQIGLAGSVSAVFTTPIMAPQERLKCVLQTQKPGPNGKLPSMMDVAKALHKEGGLLNLCRGTTVTVIRDASASFMYFSSYEVMKYKMRQISPTGELNLLHYIMAGGVAGMLNWVPAIPFDVLKTNYQAAPLGKYTGCFIGARPVYKALLAEGGIAALYKGTAPIFARAFPANAACFTGYELCLKLLTTMGL